MVLTKTNGKASMVVPESESTSKSSKGTPAKKVLIPRMHGGSRRGLGILDFFLRICALIAALFAATTMGTTDVVLPFFTQFFKFEATYDDIPTFVVFVVMTGFAGGYLVLSLPFSIIVIIRPPKVAIKLLLLILDLLMMACTIAAAGASASMVYLAHNGNENANWQAICMQFNDYCKRVSGAVVAALVASFIFIFLVVLSGIVIRQPL